MRKLILILCLAFVTHVVSAQTTQDEVLEDLPSLGKHIIVKNEANNSDAVFTDTIIMVNTVEQVGQSLAITELSGPVDKYLNIKTSADFDSYEVYNKSGEKVVNKTPYSAKIDMSALDKGMYVIKLVNSEGEAGKLNIIKQ